MDPTLRNLLSSYLEGEEDAAGPLRDWLLERGEERAADMVLPESLANAPLLFELVGTGRVSCITEVLPLAPWLNQGFAAREVKKLLRKATGQEWSVRKYETGFVVTEPLRWRRDTSCALPFLSTAGQATMTRLLGVPCLPHIATVCGETAALRRELILRLRAVCARLSHPGKV